MQHYSIGAVERITQIPAHTIRKWESRHGIAVPERTDTGRRIYTDAHIECLQHIKRLTEAGHALAHLAQLSLDGLAELADSTHSTTATELTEDITLIGPNVVKLLPNVSNVKHRDPQALETWLQQQPRPQHPVLVIEAASISRASLPALYQLSETVRSLIVIYHYASKGSINDLRQHAITALEAPVHDQDLVALLQSQAVEPNHSATHRFSTEELARIADMNAGLQCECPNHIAKLLMDISAFEQYSNGCVDEDPAEAALHKRLGNLSAQARALMEDALIAVAAADGLALKLRN